MLHGEAITICNMNKVRKSAVQNIPTNSSERSVVKSLCARGGISSDNETITDSATWTLYRKVLLDVSNSVTCICHSKQQY